MPSIRKTCADFINIPRGTLAPQEYAPCDARRVCFRLLNFRNSTLNGSLDDNAKEAIAWQFLSETASLFKNGCGFSPEDRLKMNPGAHQLLVKAFDRMIVLRNEIEDEVSLNLYDSGAASKQYLQILERRFRANWNVDAEAKSAGPAEPVHVIFDDAPEAERGAL